MPSGIAQSVWDAAKEQARELMIGRARVLGMVTYSDLARGITALDADDVIFFHLLGEISGDEDAAGRGMLSAIVVRKYGDQEPGTGFFDWAGQLGRDTSDRLRCWVTELHRVHAVWGR